MRRYVLRRCLAAVVMLVISSVIIFAALRLLPGSPVIARLAGAKNITPEARAALTHQLGLDRPLVSQYLQWVTGAVHGDFGSSYLNQYPVSTLIGQRIWPTLELAAGSFIVAVLIALVFALVPLIRDSKIISAGVTGWTVLGLSAPGFLIGIAVLLLFGNALGWIPHTTFESLTKNPGRNLSLLIAPSVTLGAAISAPLINYLRASLRDAQESAYVTTAIGAGVRHRRVVTGHITPNALLPALTYLGIVVGGLLGGVVEVEYVFGWPGIGSLIVSAVTTRDYAVIQSIVLLVAVVYVLASLIVDLLYVVIDPRLRVQSVDADPADSPVEASR
jgi:peptide/nickel transport system permease protein